MSLPHENEIPSRYFRRIRKDAVRSVYEETQRTVPRRLSRFNYDGFVRRATMMKEARESGDLEKLERVFARVDQELATTRVIHETKPYWRLTSIKFGGVECSHVFETNRSSEFYTGYNASLYSDIQKSLSPVDGFLVTAVFTAWYPNTPMHGKTAEVPWPFEKGNRPMWPCDWEDPLSVEEWANRRRLFIEPKAEEFEERVRASVIGKVEDQARSFRRYNALLDIEQMIKLEIQLATSEGHPTRPLSEQLSRLQAEKDLLERAFSKPVDGMLQLMRGAAASSPDAIRMIQIQLNIEGDPTYLQRRGNLSVSERLFIDEKNNFYVQLGNHGLRYKHDTEQWSAGDLAYPMTVDTIKQQKYESLDYKSEMYIWILSKRKAAEEIVSLQDLLGKEHLGFLNAEKRVNAMSLFNAQTPTTEQIAKQKIAIAADGKLRFITECNAMAQLVMDRLEDKFVFITLENWPRKLRNPRGVMIGREHVCVPQDFDSKVMAAESARLEQENAERRKRDREMGDLIDRAVANAPDVVFDTDGSVLIDFIDEMDAENVRILDMAGDVVVERSESDEHGDHIKIYIADKYRVVPLSKWLAATQQALQAFRLLELVTQKVGQPPVQMLPDEIAEKLRPLLQFNKRNFLFEGIALRLLHRRWEVFNAGIPALWELPINFKENVKNVPRPPWYGVKFALQMQATLPDAWFAFRSFVMKPNAGTLQRLQMFATNYIDQGKRDIRGQYVGLLITDFLLFPYLKFEVERLYCFSGEDFDDHCVRNILVLGRDDDAIRSRITREKLDGKIEYVIRK